MRTETQVLARLNDKFCSVYRQCTKEVPVERPVPKKVRGVVKGQETMEILKSTIIFDKTNKQQKKLKVKVP